MKDRMRRMGMWNLYKMGGITPAIASVFGAQNAQQMAFIRSMLKEQGQHTFEAPLSELEAVVFDLETTGFSPYQGDEIISVGAVVMNGGAVKEEETFYRLVNPKRPIPADITELTGITEHMALEADEIIDVLKDFLEYVKQRVLIVHGSGHDKHFLNSALWKTSRMTLTLRMLDCMLVAKWLEPKQKDHSLDALLERYGVEVTQRHHALHDAVMTAKLWSVFVQEAAARQVHTLGDLYAYLSRP